eukprot:scaffold4740_cov165-Amphora_coffeaeformis.AAC.6
MVEEFIVGGMNGAVAVVACLVKIDGRFDHRERATALFNHPQLHTWWGMAYTGKWVRRVGALEDFFKGSHVEI